MRLDDEWVPRLRAALRADDTFVHTSDLLQGLGVSSHSGTTRRLRRCMNELCWEPHRDSVGRQGYRPGRKLRVAQEGFGMSKETHTEDEFGVIRWGDISDGDRYCHEAENPFNKWLEACEKTAPEGLTSAAVLTHDDLRTAQSIAVSLFGRQWPSYIFLVYDRLKAEQLRARGEG